MHRYELCWCAVLSVIAVVMVAKQSICTQILYCILLIGLCIVWHWKLCVDVIVVVDELLLIHLQWWRASSWADLWHQRQATKHYSSINSSKPTACNSKVYTHASLCTSTDICTVGWYAAKRTVLRSVSYMQATCALPCSQRVWCCPSPELVAA